MARINIEEKWWTDPRRKLLIKLYGGSDELADGTAMNLWRLAQQYIKDGRSVIPDVVLECMTEAKSKLIEAKLIKPEANGCYVCGSAEFLSWLEIRRENAKKGGKSKSHLKTSSLKQYRSKTEANESKTEASSSNSSSISISVEHRTKGRDQAPDLALVPQAGPPAVVSAAPPPPVKRKSSTHPKTPNLIGTYIECFQKAYGTRPTMLGKEISHLSSILAYTPLDHAQKLVQAFFQMSGERDFFKIRKHDIATLVNNLNVVSVALDRGQEAKVADEDFQRGMDQLRAKAEGSLQ